VAEPTDELPDPLVACLPVLVHAQRLLATQVQRQMGTLHFRIVIQLGQDFAGDRRLAPDTPVEVHPGSLFLVSNAGVSRARTWFLKGHGASP